MISLLKVFIYYPLISLLMFFIWATPGDYAAVGIVLLTLFVRFILLVPSRRAARDQHRMASLQPVMDELKKQYGDDKQGLATAQMELWKKNNINPFSSCITLLIQLPVIYILYYAFLHGFNVDNPHIYSFVPKPEYINPMFFGIDLFKKSSLPILPIIAAILQYFQVKMTMPASKPKSDDPTASIQRNMTFILPVVTYMAAQGLVAGISLYWIVTTIFSIVQQYFVNKEKVRLQTLNGTVTVEPESLEVVSSGKERAVQKEVTPKISSVKEEVTTKKGVSVTVRHKK